MARALQDILTELNSVYAPQKDLYNQQLNTLDPQMDAEQKGLQAQQQDSFNQITQGANRRGLLFSGIPLAEQAQYTGSSFLPAVANLKAKYAQQKFNLQDALAKINQDQNSQAYDMYNKELTLDAANRAAASGSGGANPSFGYSGSTGGGYDANAGTLGNNVPLQYQDLVNRMFYQDNGQQWDDQSLINDFNATYKSAGYGNTNDKLKLELYYRMRPDLFGSSIPTRTLDNGSELSF